MIEGENKYDKMGKVELLEEALKNWEIINDNLTMQVRGLKLLKESQKRGLDIQGKIIIEEEAKNLELEEHKRQLIKNHNTLMRLARSMITPEQMREKEKHIRGIIDERKRRGEDLGDLRDQLSFLNMLYDLV